MSHHNHSLKSLVGRHEHCAETARCPRVALLGRVCVWFFCLPLVI